MRASRLTTLLVLLAASTAGAQAPPADDPSRPYPGFMRLYATTRGFSLGRPTGFRITPDGKTVLYLKALPTRPQLQLHALDLSTGEATVLLTPDQLLKGAEETLSVEEKARRERMRITVGGFTSFGLSDDGTRVLLPLGGKLYTFERATRAVHELPVPPGVLLDPRFSPDARAVAYVRDNELCVMDPATGKERVLTTGGSAVKTHGLAEFVAQEEMDRMQGYWWSPDGSALLYEEADNSPVEEFHIADPMHPEAAPIPFRYPRAGTANAVTRVGIISARGGRTTWAGWDAARWPYLAAASWEKNAPPTLVVQSRDQREEAVLAVDPATGVTTVLLTETDDAWLNLHADNPRWLEDGRHFLWHTERGGGDALELHARDGTLVRTVAGPDSGLRELLDVDATAGVAYFSGGDDPTMNALHAVPLEGGKVTRLSTAEGMRTIRFGRDHRTYVESRSSRDAWRVVEVRRVDGTLLASLPAAAVTPPFVPNATWMKVGDGAGFHAVVVKPRAFDPARRYPAVLDVYAGPGHNSVLSTREMYLRDQWIADHGYIVIAVDGRGTPNRGRAWERAIRGAFGTVPLQDQVSGLKLVAREVPQVDLERVGILGWSFGGYMSALAVMRRPDVFRTAVAGAPVVDWRDYDTHYTERYLGVPDQALPAYLDASLLTHAAELTRPLLLIHGTADDNVYFFHSLKLSDALLRAGRPHTVLPLSGFTHMVPDPLVTERLWQRMVDHLSETLHP